jgi:hypothetical protein
MPDPDPLEAFAARGVHVYDDGRPRPVRSPHEILADALEAQDVTVDVLVRLVSTIIDTLVDHGLVPEEGRVTPDAFERARNEIRAADAIDRAIGLTGRWQAEGLIEPFRATLRRAEAAHPCGGCCSHDHREERPR